MITALSAALAPWDVVWDGDCQCWLLEGDLLTPVTTSRTGGATEVPLSISRPATTTSCSPRSVSTEDAAGTLPSARSSTAAEHSEVVNWIRNAPPCKADKLIAPDRSVPAGALLAQRAGMCSGGVTLSE
jgi:hypothetical protein